MTKNWNNLREVTGTLVSELAGRDKPNTENKKLENMHLKKKTNRESK